MALLEGYYFSQVQLYIINNINLHIFIIWISCRPKISNSKNLWKFVNTSISIDKSLVVNNNTNHLDKEVSLNILLWWL